MFRPFVVFCLVVGLASTGCGSSAGPSSVDEPQMSFAAATAIGDVGTCPLVTTPSEANASVDTLITWTRKWPDYRYEDRTLRQVLSDLATPAEDCDPQLARKIELAVDTL
jgi:hypothetical protein